MYGPVRLSAAGCLLALCATRPASAQDTFDFSGLVYSDYYYDLVSPDGASDGMNGFTYRRVYFTADFDVSEQFSGRFRLEANDGSTTSEGRPAPFVKDLFLTWHDALGQGHDLEAGVTSPPSFIVSERVFGYRSLEKTIQDRRDIVSSRDMGILLSGPVAADGSVRYGVMLANNESVSPEDDRHKRLYGQLEIYPGDGVSLTLGADYASYPDGHAFNVNAFAGFATEGLRIGAEGFFSPRRYDDLDSDLERVGLTGFVVIAASESVNAVLRVDRSSEDFAGQETTNTLALAGVGVRVDSGVEIIPNILYEKGSRDEDAMISGRITLVVTIR